MAAPIAKRAVVKTAVEYSRKYLVHFASEHLDFKLPELKSIASLLGISFTINEGTYEKKNPFLVVDMPSEEHAKKLMTRTVLVKSLYELWGQGSNRKELYENLGKYPVEQSNPFLAEGSSFKINVETFNKKITLKEKVERIEDIPLDCLNLKGKVNLKSPQHVFSLLEYFGPEGSPTSEEPYELYFGRWKMHTDPCDNSKGYLRQGQRHLSSKESYVLITNPIDPKIANGQRDKIQEYHLQNRHFIGNTSMDACLSLIMANMGLVKKNSFVFDPFVGTGSLLVASAHFGGYVMGTDLDYLLLHAKGKPSRHNQTKRAPDESIRANLAQYGFEKAYIDAVVADASKHDMWRHHGMFDAIITDPPYGIREPAKKIANNDMDITDDVKESHIPQRVQYQLSDIFKDLLNFSAKFLRLHGRLVFWFPVIRPEYSESNVPRHPCFELVANSEQPLATRIGRRLITLEKVREFETVECESGATYDVDHFGDSSFRDRYFKNARETSPNRRSAKRSPKWPRKPSS